MSTRIPKLRPFASPTYPTPKIRTPSPGHQLLITMDSLAGYSSSDDEAEPASQSCSSLALQTSTKAPPPDLASLVLYSENYAMNRKNLLSGFVLMPWAPEPRVVASLVGLTDRVTDRIHTKLPWMTPRYNWHFAGANKPTVFGRYGYSNKVAVNSLHLSLFPNFHTDRHRFKQLHANLARAIKACPPPAEMTREKTPSKLDQMIQKTGNKKYVSLLVEDSLRCYLSTRSGTIFVALDINNGTGVPGQKFLPEYQYLRLISRTVEDQAQAFDCQYDWVGLARSNERLEDGLPFFRYHLTVVLGEISLFKHKLTPAEFERFKKVVHAIDVRDILKDITVDVQTLRLQDINNRTYDVDLVNS